jgi:hypothetical protein
VRDQLAQVEQALFIHELHTQHEPHNGRMEGHWYRLDDESDVDRNKRMLAARVCSLAALECGIAPPRLRWFGECPRTAQRIADHRTWRAPAHNGWADVGRGIILVRSNLTRIETAQVVAHEVRHCAQQHVDEHDATAYASLMEARLAHRTRIRSHVGFPYSSTTLAGTADHGELLLAHDHDSTHLALYRNVGARRAPRWSRLSRPPRDTRASAAWRLGYGVLTRMSAELGTTLDVRSLGVQHRGPG